MPFLRPVVIVLLFELLHLLGPLPGGAAPRPEVRYHRAADEGYFVATLKMPSVRPEDRLAMFPQRVSGDIYLLNVSQDWSDKSADITVAGRYGKPGAAAVAVLARPAMDPKAEPKELVRISLDLPSAAAEAAVMKSWAQLQLRRVNAAGFKGGDSFRQYWNAMASNRYGTDTPGYYRGGPEGRDLEPPDLYSVFTGAAAIQESLQLDRFGVRGRTSQRSGDTGTAKPALHSLTSLTGPAVRSHPFAEMLKGKNVRVSPLASYLPADQYAVFFADFRKQLELADLMEEWGDSLLHQLSASARDFKIRRKLSLQLCLETDALARMFGDHVIGSMAFTGSTPFLKEGADFAVLFTLKKKDLFLDHLRGRQAAAVAEHKAQRRDFTTAGRQVYVVSTPDRTISSYAVILNDIAVVANDLEALKRVMDAAAGRRPSLAAALDYRYLRTIFPEGDAKEDVFVYLSDAHIRRLVSAPEKIGEARRMLCAANLETIANARLWFAAERRRQPALADLESGGYLGKEVLRSCPEGGTYALYRAGQPACSIHNRAGFLTPLPSIRLAGATDTEAAQYRAFVEGYNRYWSRFFDPIGIRFSLGPTIRIETCILPLIENSWYDGLVALAGRDTGRLAEAAVLPRTILSLRTRISREWLKNTDYVRTTLAERNIPVLSWIGDEAALHLCDGPVLFTVEGRTLGLLQSERGGPSLGSLVAGYVLSALNLPTYASVQVTDRAQAERALPYLLNIVPYEYRRDGTGFETYTLEPHRGTNIHVYSFSLFFARLRLYAAVVGDQLVIASRRNIVEDLIDRPTAPPSASTASMELSIYRTAFREIEPIVSQGYQEDLRHACQANLALADTLLDLSGVLSRDLRSAAFSLRGYDPYCPSGGAYVTDPAYRRAVCTVHGPAFRPVQPSRERDGAPFLRFVNSLKRVNARLAFTPEGLMTTVEIQRAPARE